MFVLEPVTLEGQYVRLEPLAPHHADDLMRAAANPAIWSFLPTVLLTAEQLQRWLVDTLALAEAGTVRPFATIDLASGRAIGSTRYMNIMPADRGLEIGWTWLAPQAWRTAVNSECKYMLLRHAFETLGCIRVQIKTDRRNERSRSAIERLGAQFEGMLRQHMIVRDGVYRDTAMYSIIDSEWPAVKAQLGQRLYGAPAAQAAQPAHAE